MKSLIRIMSSLLAAGLVAGFALSINPTEFAGAAPITPVDSAVSTASDSSVVSSLLTGSAVGGRRRHFGYFYGVSCYHPK